MGGQSPPGLVFKRVSSPEAAAEYIAKTIGTRLANGQSVLWLVPGGSAMTVAVEAFKRLSRDHGLAKLIITLTDERYGPPGHPDSNWQQLRQAGFTPDHAQLLPVLTGESMPQTVKAYQSLLDTAAARVDYSLALAGMGPDGHIFGILPHSPAVDSPLAVCGYEWGDHTRMTPTAGFIKKLDEVVIYAVGEPKWPQIAKLKDSIPAADQPAQLLKQLTKVIFFNDYQGEPL